MQGEQQPSIDDLTRGTKLPERITDEQRIELAIQTARAEDREVDDATARRIASQLHGGQASALYSLASTGNLTHERLEAELSELYQDHNPQIQEWAGVLGTYALHREHRGSVDGWAELTADRPRIAPREVGAVAVSDTLSPDQEDDPDASARADLMRRLEAASVTTLGQVATIIDGSPTFEANPDQDEIDDISWTDAARWRPDDDRDELTAERLDELFDALPDAELDEVADVGSFRLLRHDRRSGGLILHETDDGQRRAWETSSDEELLDRWTKLQHQRNAYLEATGTLRRWSHQADEAGRVRNVSGPRIWVASLSDYNNGRLYGAWLNAGCDPGVLREAAAFLLRGSSEPDAEEYAIFDYEGFGDLRLGEYASLETVSTVAQGIEVHGLAFAAWAEYVGVDSHEQLERFLDHYRGEWEDMEAYVKDVLDNIGFYHALDDALKIIPEDLRSYIDIDVESLARDWGMEMHVVERGGGGVWVFDVWR